jgi:hypothetical protein
MLTLILLIPSVICFIVIFATYRSQAKYKKGMLFAVKLPAHAMDDRRMQAVQAHYAKRFNRIGVVMLAALLPLVPLHAYFAFQFLYFFAWLTAMFIALPMTFRRAFRETLALKRRNKWYVGESAQGGRPGESDDDEYWANGFTYHNPQDRRILVPKRVGIGETVNTGTTVGKLIMGGAVGLAAVVMIGTSYLLIRSEYTAPSLTTEPGGIVEIDYPMYHSRFRIADIEELALVEDVPGGKRVNGEATAKYARGHFRLKELGKARLYIFRDNPPYIRIKLEDAYIFYNEKDPERTKQVYEQLRSSRDPSSSP